MKLIYYFVLVVLLVACSQQELAQGPPDLFGQPLTRTAIDYLKQAQALSSPDREANQLLAVLALLQAGDPVQAQELLTTIKTENLPPELMAQKQLIHVHLQLVDNKTDLALNTLRTMSEQQAMPNNNRHFRDLLIAAYMRAGKVLESVQERIKLTDQLNQEEKEQNDKAIWRSLQTLSAQKLTNLQHSLQVRHDEFLRAWFQIAYLAKAYSNNEGMLNKKVQAWQKKYPTHPANQWLTGLSAVDQTTHEKDKIMLLLPLHGPLSVAGHSIKNGFMTAYYRHREKQPVEIDVLDTTQSDDIIALYQKAVQQGASFIVGPLAKDRVDTLLVKGTISVPTLALNYSHSTHLSQDNFFQFGLSPLDEARQAAEQAWRADHSRAIIVTPEGQWGQDVADVFASTFRNLGGTVVDRLAYKPDDDMTNKIKHLLHVDESQQRANELASTLKEKLQVIPHRREDFNVFFLVANPTVARQIRPLLKFYFAGDVPVYATSSVYSGVSMLAMNRDLEGVYFCDMPWIIDNKQGSLKLRRQLAKLWPSNYEQRVRLYALGMDAYQLSRIPEHLVAFPTFSVQGMTGGLTMDNAHRIHRRLEWIQMRDGKLSYL